MYSDFFEQIDAARNGRRGGRSSDAAIIPEVPPLVSFMAGKMKMIEQPAPAPYKCEADPTRGEVRLVWNSSDRKVQWQWYDRRSKKVVDKFTITDAGSTFERIDLSASKKHKNDRVYVWTKKEGDAYSYDMYWMQNASDEKDDEIVAQVNQYLADLDSAAPEGTATAMDTETNTSNATASLTRTTGISSDGTSTSTSSSQVDVLSSILENLGMPQSDSGVATVGDADGTGGGGSASGSASGGATKQLTLADLQGAMAGIHVAQQQQQSAASAGPPLNELITSDAVTAILESDDSVKQRLIALLPEGQQTEEFLAENLRSPQVQQTLRTLTQALLPEENGDLSGYASVIANFNLDAADGQQSLASGNPIQAFLDCIIQSVEKGKNDNENEQMESNNDVDGNDGNIEEGKQEE
jgi:UCH-binding domain/Proteasome complex subunit Rpn13 ubiquitin receptor